MGGGECCRAFGIANAGRVKGQDLGSRLPHAPQTIRIRLAWTIALLCTGPPSVRLARSKSFLGGGSAGGKLGGRDGTYGPRDEGLPLPAAVVLLTPSLI